MRKRSPIIRTTDAEQLSIIDDIETSLTFHERNFFMLPLFFLSSKQVGSQDIIEKKFKTKAGEGLWRVSPNVELGMGGPFDDAVLVALNKYISAQPKPITNPVDMGSLKGIARVMGYKNSGVTVLNMIKTSIKRMVALLITSKYTFFEKSQESYLSDAAGVFHILDKAIFVNEVYEGKKSDRNLIWLNDNFLRNINARYVAPLDYDFYMQLKYNISKALVKLLTFSFFANRANKTPVIFKYSTICERTTLIQRKQQSVAKQQLLPALNELKDKAYLKTYTWTPIQGKGDDWYISFWPGDRAQKYIKFTIPYYDAAKKIDVDFVREFDGSQDNIPKLHHETEQPTGSLFDQPSQQDVDEVIFFYESAFRAKYDNPPSINKKRDGEIIQALLKKHSVQDIKRLIRIFLNNTEDEYVRNSGYTLPMFKTVLNKLIIKLSAEMNLTKKEKGLEVKESHQPWSDISMDDIKKARKRIEQS